MEMTYSDVWVMVQAAVVSLGLALGSITLGTVLGVVLTLLAFAPFAPARIFYRLYVFIIRGTPVLLLALLTFYALAAFWGRINPYAAGVVVLTMYLGALIAEVFRGGVLAIPHPLWDLARSSRAFATVDFLACRDPARRALLAAALSQRLCDGSQGVVCTVNHQCLGADNGLPRDHRAYARRISRANRGRDLLFRHMFRD